MRKLVVLAFVTLDGVMQAPGGPQEDTSHGFEHGGWTVPYFDEEAGQIMAKQMTLKGNEILLGRKTYEIFAGYWPHHAEDWPGINDVKKYVATHNATFKPEWENSIALTGNVAEKVKKLKNEDGPDLQVWGSSNLIQTLLKSDLVDELWLKIFPVVIGNGKRLFGEGTIPVGFELTHSNATKSGVLIANYKRAGNIKTGSFEQPEQK